MVGADRYRNPDDDLPQDFEARRADYYRRARPQPGRRRRSSPDLRARLTEALRTLNKQNPRAILKVRILWRGKNRISITPFEPLPAAPNLDAIKAELERRWPMTDLIDVLMETARQTGFLDDVHHLGGSRRPGRATRCANAWCSASMAWAPMPA